MRTFVSPETEKTKQCRPDSPQKTASFRPRTGCRFGTAEWWGRSGPNCMLPTQTSNQSPDSSQERNFSAQRQTTKFWDLSSIEGAETALNKESGRHVFDVAEEVRASLTLHNLRVWVVGATGIEPVTPSMSTRCSPAELRALKKGLDGCGPYIGSKAPPQGRFPVISGLISRRIRPPASCSLR